MSRIFDEINEHLRLQHSGQNIDPLRLSIMCKLVDNDNLTDAQQDMFLFLYDLAAEHVTDRGHFEQMLTDPQSLFQMLESSEPENHPELLGNRDRKEFINSVVAAHKLLIDTGSIKIILTFMDWIDRFGKTKALVN